jgi:hypothetical protein
MKAKKSVVLDIQKDIPDPQRLPWPVKTGSVSEIICTNVFEFIPGKARGKFMDECYRVLAPEGKATFAIRYWNSAPAIQDYRYEWPPIAEQSFLYFNKNWREANSLKLGLACDFDFTYGYSVDPDTANRNDETRSFAIKNYSNCVNFLQVVLTKRG